MFKRIKVKFQGIKHDFIRNSRKIGKSEELKAIILLLSEILAYGILAALTYLAFTQEHILIKLLGFGSGIWLFKHKLLPVFTELFGSISLVRIYK